MGPAWSYVADNRKYIILRVEELPHMPHLSPWTSPLHQGFCSYLDGTD